MSTPNNFRAYRHNILPYFTLNRLVGHCRHMTFHLETEMRKNFPKSSILAEQNIICRGERQGSCTIAQSLAGRALASSGRNQLYQTLTEGMSSNGRIVCLITFRTYNKSQCKIFVAFVRRLFVRK